MNEIEAPVPPKPKSQVKPKASRKAKPVRVVERTEDFSNLPVSDPEDQQQLIAVLQQQIRSYVAIQGDEAEQPLLEQA